MTTIESPLLRFGKDFSADAILPENEVIGIGAKPFASYTELQFAFSQVFVSIAEMSDNEVVQLAESSNSFAFLDSPEEDIYNDLLKSKE